jgi:hypothetical protein
MSDFYVNNIFPQSTNTVDVNGAKIKGDLTGFSVYIGDIDKPTLPTESVLIGVEAGNNLSSGIGNTVIGHKAMYNPTSSLGNVCVGSYSGYSLNGGIGNVYVGNSAGYSVTSGTSNTAIGNGAGGSITTGVNNTFIGGSTGNTYPAFTGNGNICIGYSSNPATSSVNNSITLGDASINVFRCAVTTITSLSDERDKKDIKDLSTGLEFVETLRPVEFIWNDRDEKGRHDVADFGFIAQDLKKAQEDAEKSEVLKLVYDENPDKLEASYGKLIPILVKAIQELSEEVKQLKSK